MNTVTVEEVQARLPELLDRIARGEYLIITRDGTPVATLTLGVPKGIPILGRGKGRVLYMAPDFDAPLDDFKEELR